MKTKFYVGYRSAEGESNFVVELSKSEYKAVLKFVYAQYGTIYDEGYSGTFSISDKGFNTEEEAIQYAKHP